MAVCVHPGLENWGSPATSGELHFALRALGLSPPEAAVYLSLLGHGARPASRIARSVGLRRTGVYDVLASLEDRRLVEVVERNGSRHFTVTSPDHLLNALRAFRDQFERQCSTLESDLPKLFESRPPLAPSVDLRSVRGALPVRDALNAVLATAGPAGLLAVGSVEDELEPLTQLHFRGRSFRARRLSAGAALRVCLCGPPGFSCDRLLGRETLHSPLVPAGIRLLASESVALLLDIHGVPQATRIDSPLLCSALHGLSSSWAQAASGPGDKISDELAPGRGAPAATGDGAAPTCGPSSGPG
jgi:hypothetical protein